MNLVEKIIVSPEDIRGLGNIINPKSVTDFTVEDCIIEDSTDTVNGTTMPVYKIYVPVIYIDDDATSDNSSTLFGDSIALRNSGENDVGYSNGYYTITNMVTQAESMVELSDLTGVTDDFIIEYDSYIEGASGSSGLVIYNSSTSWEKLTDDGDSNKKLWYGYHDGTFHETVWYGEIQTNQKWVHYKYTVQGTTFKMEVIYNDEIVATRTETIHLTRGSSTKYGLDSEWGYNTTTRYKNLYAYKI